MKKTAFIAMGILLGFYGFAQGLQLMGLIGTKTFTIPGVVLSVLGFALAAGCFKNAFKAQHTDSSEE